MTDPTSKAARPMARTEPGRLKAELQARIAEAEWLKRHYDEQLRAAFAQIASLQARLHAAVSTKAAPQRETDEAEMGRLRREVERLSAGETRYLDRIEELKGMLSHDG